jgi:molybdate transport system substrate-binding protein
MLLPALVAVVLAGCSGSALGPSSAGARELVVYAAASLGSVMADVAAAYEAAHPGTSIVVSTDSSAALATKIEQGAPADVFLSADTANAQRLAEDGLVAGSLVGFATNALALVVPIGNPAGVNTPADLARPGVKVIAAGEAVPITRYADQLVANLAREPGYPADFAAAYAANIVSREDNVSGVVARVALGEGDAGIVYATDARGSGRVTAIDIPAAANVPATYAGVVVAASSDIAGATAFLDWLAGPGGQPILAAAGFSGPGE